MEVGGGGTCVCSFMWSTTLSILSMTRWLYGCQRSNHEELMVILCFNRYLCIVVVVVVEIHVQSSNMSCSVN